MSLNHIILIAVACGTAAVAAPTFAPALLGMAVHPPAVETVADAPSEASRRTVEAVTPIQAFRPPEPEPMRVTGRKVALRADQRGHYQVDAVVNGRTLAAIVDTGATTVALTSDSARRAGIYLSPRDFTVRISTANGVVAAAPVMLGSIRVGRITVHNVQAVVLPGNVLATNLLGMSFLSRLSKFEVAGGQLVLSQ